MIKIIDTNVILRFLLNDEPLLFVEAQKIFEDAQAGKFKIYIDEIVLAETIWVLMSYYSYTKSEVCSKLIKMLSHAWIVNPQKKIILRALALYSEKNFDFVDCWVYCLSQEEKIPLVTFDKKLKKLK